MRKPAQDILEPVENIYPFPGHWSSLNQTAARIYGVPNDEVTMNMRIAVRRAIQTYRRVPVYEFGQVLVELFSDEILLGARVLGMVRGEAEPYCRPLIVSLAALHEKFGEKI